MEDLADLYENAPCGYLSLSPDARIVKVNRTLTDWLNHGDESLVGIPFHNLLSFGGRIAFETHMAPLLRLQGFVDEIAIDLLCADGSKLPMIANAKEKRGADNEHVFTRLTIFKAVDRRAYERGLLAEREQAEAAAAAEHETSVLREQFIAVLGHDLRNPLAALGAGIRMLSQRETLSERGQLVAKEMAESVSRSMALIENVLDFARGRLGEGISLTRSPTDLAPIVDQVVAEIRAIVPDRKIVTYVSLEDPVDCDAGRIGQLISNLVSNAVTHGAIGIPIEVAAHLTDDHLVISVANGGPPIPEATRAHLFQPFFRGAVRRSQNGLGLGLFIVHEIARAHGGSLVVESNDAETRFTFSMPLDDRGPSTRSNS